MGLLDKARQRDALAVETPSPRSSLSIAITIILIGGALGLIGLVLSNLPRTGAPIITPQKEALHQSKSPVQGDRISRYTRPVQELMSYADALRAGRASFDPSISGEEAARQRANHRLFASIYEELRVVAAKTPSHLDVLGALDKIIEQEQGIDYLMGRRLRVTPIAYLRALQNGDVGFPAPADWAPTPKAIVDQLANLYPQVQLDRNDAIFAYLYRQTREFAASEVSKSGEISVYQIISELRKAIIQSVLKPPPLPGEEL